MRIGLAAVGISGGLAATAAARIGETEGQCLSRYGEVLAKTPAHLPGAESVTFLRQGIRVRVEFVNDRAVYISFSKRGLREDERLTLLTANSGGLEWRGPENYAGRSFWRAATAGGDFRIASYYVTGPVATLEIASREWIEGISIRRQASIAEALASISAPPPAAPAPADSPEAPAAAPPPDRPVSPHLEGF